MPNNKNWLIVGGAGYIGAHVIRSFLKNGLNIFVIDNLSTGKIERIPRSVEFLNLDCNKSSQVNSFIKSNKITGVVHLAALKHARESSRKPLDYWDKNLSSIIGLLKGIEGTKVDKLLFSSSCSIYGANGEVNESSPLEPMSTYGRTKLVSEMIIKDCLRYLNLSVINLRYFNVIGNDIFPFAHDTSRECLIPALYDCYVNKNLPEIFGTNFNTPDGSALRDYIDVRDLSNVHYIAADYLMKNEQKVQLSLNIGKGKPYSVLQIIDSFYRAVRKPIEYVDRGKNDVDPDMVWANNDKFKKLFNWLPDWGLDESIRSFLDSKEKYKH